MDPEERIRVLLAAVAAGIIAFGFPAHAAAPLAKTTIADQQSEKR
jgi:hypothetical protein